MGRFHTENIVVDHLNWDNKQYRFFPARSTADTLIIIIHRISEILDNKYIQTINLKKLKALDNV